jgi:hypothetical protein
VVELVSFWDFLVSVVFPGDSVDGSDLCAAGFGPFAVAVACFVALPFPAAFFGGFYESLEAG